MAITFQVITSLLKDGSSLLGTKRLAVRIADEAIVSGSLLTVEGNEFCVLKSRGAILNVYEMGQHTVTTPDKLLVGSIVQGLFGGSSPWVYEVIYVNRSKLVLGLNGTVNSVEMQGVFFHMEGYIHVDSTQGALALVQHMPFNGHLIDTAEIIAYITPAVSQAVARAVQVTPLTQLYTRIDDIREFVRSEVAQFLAGYGITLSDMKLVLYPESERFREILKLQSTMGLTSQAAVRYHLASRMAEKGLITAPNAAAGTAFTISATTPA